MSRTSRKNRRARRPKATYLDRVKAAYDQDALARICELDEADFAGAFHIDRYKIEQEAPFDYYYFKDNGSNILAVAHLDTVQGGRYDGEKKAAKRRASFVDTNAGPVVFSGALDDRLGAYTILDMLPKLGVNVDVLLTTGEESGQSTAYFFDAPEGKDYNWIIEFDRGGTDVVMYQYDDEPSRKLLIAAGARPGDGIFSDIAELEHLQCKAFNWGIGYQDYHEARSHAYLDDTFAMIAQFLVFHEANSETWLMHSKPKPKAAHMPWWVAAEGKDGAAASTMSQLTSYGKQKADADWWENQDSWEWDEHDSANWLYGPKQGGVRRLLDTRSDEERDGDTGRPAVLEPEFTEVPSGDAANLARIAERLSNIDRGDPPF